MLRLIPRISTVAPHALLSMGLPPHLAHVLYARGVNTPEEARAFLSPSREALHAPMLLSDMERAVQRIRRAIAEGERICVYGDYDVDGICAAALLIEALRAHGADVFGYIPSRHREGYGLNADAVRGIAGQAKLLITVDCGITSVREADVARDEHLDLIITDHHEPPERLPQALAVIDPLLGAYPFRRLCGAGVAFKLGEALFGPVAMEPLLELAALATVADLVPLLGENRIIVSLGLEKMQKTRRVGLRALFDVSGLSGRTLTAGHLGFQIAPRMNAGGRLTDASRALELLLTEDEQLAARIAGELNDANQKRQRMEADILAKADEWVTEHMDFLSGKVIMVCGEGWNTGVIGLVASRLTERYGWPTVILSETEGVLTGSARSIPGVNLHKALTRCEDLFLRFGGHAQAAGMTLAKENLDAFRERLHEAICELAEPDAFIPTAPYDMDMELSDVTIPMIEQLERLAPTGFGNPAPVFRLKAAQVLEKRGVGAEGKHLKLRLAQGNVSVDGIAFSQGALLPELPGTVDALFSPTINEFMGRRSVQCEISKLLPHAPLESFRDECIARADEFDCALLEAEWIPSTKGEPNVRRALIKEALESACQGTLLIARTLQGVCEWLSWLQEAGLSERISYCFGAPSDPRRFNALCAMPGKGVAEGYTQVFVLDDACVPGALQSIVPTDDSLRGLYRVLRASGGKFFSETALAEAAGMRLAAVRLGLRAFDELGLVSYRPIPFRAAMLPANKCSLSESAELSRARGLLGWEAEA